ncbi:MAG: hypothetical protein EPN93_18145 [Spirochaetes bacterium]|nr:MAG: hypothetical protein EPN93_18145 [Spirochaetota bacterium]
MKRMLFLLVSMMCATTLLFAAEEVKAPEKKDNPPATLFGGMDFNYSGYGALMYQNTTIGGHIAHLAGARGGLILDDSFVIGLSGMGVAYPNRRETLSGEPNDGLKPYAEIGWGGLLLEYHLFPKSLFHVSMGLTVGAGGISFSSHKSDNDSHDEYDGDTKVFFMMEPEIGAYVNLTRFCRLGALVSYRLSSGADHGEFHDKDIRSYGVSVAAQLGWF